MINIQELRKQVGMKSDEFAEALGLSVSSLYNKIRGEQEWTFSELAKASEIMQVNGVGEDLMVSHDGVDYRVSIRKISG